MAEATTREAVRLTATIKRGPCGLWFVRMTGNGFPIEHALTDTMKARKRLVELVEDGFVISDPEHYCEMHNIFDELISQYEDSRDATELPVARIGSGPGDNGRGLLGDDELV